MYVKILNIFSEIGAAHIFFHPGFTTKAMKLVIASLVLIIGHTSSAEDILPFRPSSAEEERQLAETLRELNPQSKVAVKAVVPTVPKCDGSANADGGFSEDRRQWRMSAPTGLVTLRFDAYNIPDTFAIRYQGQEIWSSGGLVSNANTVVVPYGPGTSTLIEVVVNEGNNADTGTAWEYQLRCAGELVLEDLNDNTFIENGGKAWITAGYPPRMPQLQARLPLAQSNTNVWWSLKGNYRITRDIFQIQPLPLPASTPWDVPTYAGEYRDSFSHSTFKATVQETRHLGADFVGGEYELKAAVNSTRSIKFRIGGKNPDNNDVITHIRNQTVFPLAPYMAQHESYNMAYREIFNQFYGLLGSNGKPSSREGLSVYGAVPEGCGMFQLDSYGLWRLVTNTERWNWVTNVESACAVMAQKSAKHQELLGLLRVYHEDKGQWEEPPAWVQINYTGSAPGVVYVDVHTACAAILYNGAGGLPSTTLRLPNKVSRSFRHPLTYSPNAVAGKKWAIRDNVQHYLGKVCAHVYQNEFHTEPVLIRYPSASLKYKLTLTDNTN